MTAVQANNTTSGRATVEAPSAALRLLGDSQSGGLLDLGALAQGVVGLARQDLAVALNVVRDLADVLPVLDLERLVGDVGGLNATIGGLIQEVVGQPVGRLVEGLTQGVQDGLGEAADGLTRIGASQGSDPPRHIDWNALGAGPGPAQLRDMGVVDPLRLDRVGGNQTVGFSGLAVTDAARHTGHEALARSAPGPIIESAIVAPIGMGRSAGVGVNTTTWAVDSVGRPVLAEPSADVERRNPESRALSTAADRSVDGGQIIAHRFVKEQGLDNPFPQNVDFNLYAYKTLENEMADWADAGAEVRVTVDLLGGGDQAVRVRVAYEVLSAAGNLIYDNTVLFRTAADQTFDRTPSSEMTTSPDE